MNEPFTPDAESYWRLVPARAKEAVLTSVWCRQCMGKTTMIRISGEMVADDLLLTGICNKCGAKVARLLEGA